jgi:hypothetical protein
VGHVDIAVSLNMGAWNWGSDERRISFNEQTFLTETLPFVAWELLVVS